jgi:crotonobetainyl-CoA:carnitine CoA-transferase CaiB-like acyl-CoA transferase
VVPSGTWRAKDGVFVVIGGNGNSVYNRLITAMGRPDMGIENERYATDAKRCEHEKEIVKVRRTLPVPLAAQQCFAAQHGTA